MGKYFRKTRIRLVLLAVAVVLLAIITRFYHLGVVPGGLAWDEAAIGYNGWSIWQTHRDEWLIKMPISFKSFGDYKAPLAIYLDGFFTTVFGLSVWAVRLPFAIAGVMAVVGLMFLTELIWPNKAKHQNWFYGIGAGLLMITSPWHHHFSRAAFESGLSLSMLIWGFVGLEWGRLLWESGTLKRGRAFIATLITKAFIATLAGLILLALTLYTYHSNKLVTPLLLFYWLWLNRSLIKKQFWQYLIGGVAMLGVLVPFFKDSLMGEGLTRAGVNIFSTLPFPQSVWVFVTNYLAHLAPSFLVFGEVTTLRHGDGKWGVLLPTVFLLVLIRVIASIYHLVTKSSKIKKVKNLKQWHYVANLAFAWLLIGLLPAALGTDVPHSNRALQALPGFLLVALLGFQFVLNFFRRIFKKSTAFQQQFLVVILLIIHLIFFGLYLQNYYTNYAATAGDDFQAGYDEAVWAAEDYLQGSADDWPVEKVIFTNDYQQAYIYVLFYKAVTPYQYHNGVLSLYEFKDDVNVGDLSRNNTLVIASKSDDIPHQSVTEEILGTDGAPRFYLYKTANQNKWDEE